MLDQAFFMPLFFLISAYFTPRSYDRKGKDKFLFEKAKRIWIPAMLGSFFLIGPLSSMIGQAVANHDEPLRYIPLPGQGWFLFWLLLYNWVYSTIREAACRDVVNEDDNNGTVAPSPVSRTRPFPSYKERLLYGILVCGFLMMIVFIFLDFFFSMPIATGSLACSTLFWLSNKILGGEQLDTPPWALYLMVLLEGSALVALFQFLDEDNPDDPSQIGMGIFFFLIAGMYCIDVSLVILGFFQAHADVRTRLLKALAEAAYTVYIIHALVITSLTAAFVAVYNKLYDENPIEFEDDDSETSETKLGGPGDGSLHLFVGWIVVFVVTQLVVWPLSWWLRRLPGFKEVL
jgi:glucan biosynthesis protein C